MGNWVCVGVLILIAFGAYTQSKKSKDADEKTKATIWMAISLLAAVFAVINIAAAIAG